MTARVLHISDLHLGRREAPETFSAVRELAAKLAPELVLATGDLAHRGKRWELERAAELLRSLGFAVMAVPGNHDIPYTFPARFTRPFANWEQIFGTTEPVYASEQLAVVGLNSAQPWSQQGGALEPAQLEGATANLVRAPEGALRMVAMHHHLASPPWRAARKRPLRRRDTVLQSLAEAGAELVVGGHVHQASVAERREFEILEGSDRRSLILATAPGIGRPRPRRRGEALGVNVYEVEPGRLDVVTHAWDGRALPEVGRRSFGRG